MESLNILLTKTQLVGELSGMIKESFTLQKGENSL